MEYRRKLRVLLKFRAKSLFAMNLGPCLVITLITHAVSMLGSYAAGLVLPSANEFVYAEDLTVYYPQILLFYGILLGVLLLMSPLTMGSYAWYSELSMMRKPKIREVFNWMGDLRLTFRAICSMLWFLAIALLWALAFLGVPVALVLFITSPAVSMDISAVVFLSGFLSFLLFTGTLLTVFRVCSYLPALFVIATHPQIRIREAFRECSLYMAGRRTEFVELLISFIGWFIVLSVTGGLAAFYVSPYFHLTLLSYAQQARGVWLAENGKEADPAWTPETEQTEEDRDV